MRNDPLPASLPLRADELVFAVDSEKARPDSPVSEPGRRLYSGWIKPAGSRIVRGTLSLPADMPGPSGNYVYQLSGAVRLLVTDSHSTAASAWAVRADGIRRLNGLEAERTGLWRPSAAFEAPVAPHTASRPLTPPSPAPTGRAQVLISAPITPVHPERSRQATELRSVLLQTASRRTTTTWAELVQTTGLDVSHLGESARRNLLVEATRPVSETTPPLCILVRGPFKGQPLPYLRTILRQLGVEVPPTEAALESWTQNAIKQLHIAHAPVRPPSTDAPNLNGRDLETAKRQVEELRSRLTEATRIVQRRSDRRADRLSEGMKRAERHIQELSSVGTHGILHRWLKVGKEIQLELDAVIGKPIAVRSRHTEKRPQVPSPIPGKANSGGAPATAKITTKPPQKITSPAIEKNHARSRSVVGSPDPLPLGLAQACNEPGQRTHAARTAATPLEPSSSPEPRTSVDPTELQREALTEFQWLVEQIRTAQAADDLESVQTARQLAGPYFYERQLAPSDRESFASFMQEVEAWCRERAPRPTGKSPLREIRKLLSGLDAIRDTVPADEAQLVLGTVEQLRLALTDPFPPAEEARLRRWQRRVGQQPTGHAPTPQTSTTAKAKPRHPDSRTVDLSRPFSHDSRLLPEEINTLAARARNILADTARAGGSPLSWGELCTRMPILLPHLHPDDQGELLVAIDRDTPPDEPLLTTLVASADKSQHWLYRHVRYSFDRPDVPDAELEAHWAREVLRLRQYWRHR